jgi:hypothetical protein
MANADEAVFANPPQEEEGVRENVGSDEPKISGIAEAMIDLMCSPTVIDTFPENEGRLSIISLKRFIPRSAGIHQNWWMRFARILTMTSFESLPISREVKRDENISKAPGRRT